MQEHADEDPVEFTYSSMVNISFNGREEAELTWGEWRTMNSDQRYEAENEFIRNTLGVEVDIVEGPPEDD